MWNGTMFVSVLPIVISFVHDNEQRLAACSEYLKWDSLVYVVGFINSAFIYSGTSLFVTCIRCRVILTEFRAIIAEDSN